MKALFFSVALAITLGSTAYAADSGKFAFTVHQVLASPDGLILIGDNVDAILDCKAPVMTVKRNPQNRPVSNGLQNSWWDQGPFLIVDTNHWIPMDQQIARCENIAKRVSLANVGYHVTVTLDVSHTTISSVTAKAQYEN